MAVSSPSRTREAFVSSGAASQTEIQLLFNRVAAAKVAAVAIGKRYDEFTQHYESRVRWARDMFRAMYTPCVRLSKLV